VPAPTGAPPHLGAKDGAAAAKPEAPSPPAPKINPGDLPPDHPPIDADEGAQVSIQWLGHACFYIYSPGGVAVVTDPFDPKATGLPAPSTGAHLITVSSDTPAHNDANQVHAFQDESGKPLPKPVVQGTEAREKDVHIVPVPTVGGATGSNRNYAYVIEAGPLRIAHLGAIGRPLDPAQAKAFGPIDILLVPVGGQGLSPKQAADVVQQLNPRIAIPMSYATPEMTGPEARLRPIADFVAACPFAVDRKEYDVMMFSRSSLPPKTEVWTLQYRR
jgi:L-ascorbate metabolism protein UlaG (beta-lactamase superfamily)